MTPFSQHGWPRVIETALLNGNASCSASIEDCRSHGRDFDVFIASEEEHADREDDGTKFRS